jgi:hypothetical protein
VRVYRNNGGQKRGTVGLIEKIVLRCGGLPSPPFHDLVTSFVVRKALMWACARDLKPVRYLGFGTPKIKPEVAGIQPE